MLDFLCGSFISILPEADTGGISKNANTASHDFLGIIHRIQSNQRSHTERRYRILAEAESLWKYARRLRLFSFSLITISQ